MHILGESWGLFSFQMTLKSSYDLQGNHCYDKDLNFQLLGLKLLGLFLGLFYVDKFASIRTGIIRGYKHIFVRLKVVAYLKLTGESGIAVGLRRRLSFGLYITP